jgi:hypothetical protein
MAWRYRFPFGCLAVLAAVLGCGKSAAPPTDTGSSQAAKDYSEAVCQRDWPRAYAVLHPESRRRYSAEQFARLAANYRHGMGFEPEKVHIRAHEEHGDEAITHLTFTGLAGGKRKFYKEALQLRRDGTQWLVVLPPQSGRRQ